MIGGGGIDGGSRLGMVGRRFAGMGQPIIPSHPTATETEIGDGWEDGW